MKQKHIILRSLGAAAFDTTFGPGAGPAATAPAPSGLVVEIEELDREHLSAVARNQDVVAIAPAMPMKLVEPVAITEAAGPAADSVAWGIKAVRADTSPFTGDGIVVAVLDTGIDSNHPAFTGVTIVEKNFTESGNGDEHGHGTHCAGTIFGRDVDNMRVGVARGVKKALIGKVLGDNGGGSDQIVSAIQWAIENGANVISMSLGIDFPGFAKYLQEEEGLRPDVATSRALEGYRANVLLFERVAGMIRAIAPFRQPALVIAAAGNESERPEFEIAVSPPAVSEGNISVAALGEGPGGFTVAYFSNTGAGVSAPGVGVLSAKAGGGLVAMSGTSMATPHVAGIAALWGEKLKAEGSFTVENWNARLVASSVTTGLTQPFDPLDVGAGLVQAPQS
jgi:subtilisin family serine protease